MSAVLENLRPGDRVRLTPRESPYHDDPDWWWEILAARSTGLDVRLWFDGRVIARRDDVALARVTAVQRFTSSDR